MRNSSFWLSDWPVRISAYLSYIVTYARGPTVFASKMAFASDTGNKNRVYMVKTLAKVNFLDRGMVTSFNAEASIRFVVMVFNDVDR